MLLSNYKSYHWYYKADDNFFFVTIKTVRTVMKKVKKLIIYSEINEADDNLSIGGLCNYLDLRV